MVVSIVEIDQQEESIRSLIGDSYGSHQVLYQSRTLWMRAYKNGQEHLSTVHQLNSPFKNPRSLLQDFTFAQALNQQTTRTHTAARTQFTLSSIMHTSSLLPFLPLLASTFAAPIDDVKRAVSTSCPSYTIINTRGTGEAQGPSTGFRTMNSRVTGALSGGKIYNTVYAAGFSQNSAAGTTDIINKITSTLRSNPNECFILEGYSQGAQATVNALPRLTGANADAVKGVFLIGNPAHKSGLECNVDNKGGSTTKNVNGISGRYGTGVPSNWVAKTLDVCIYGDGVCDTTHGSGINGPHLRYGGDSDTQNLGTTFLQKQLA
ncbi:hypothetical protein NX059_002837 [Plenodomus lindquistii]|nr:hypothetical protein NX059_002837 [Plenodomus lindquistii]